MCRALPVLTFPLCAQVGYRRDPSSGDVSMDTEAGWGQLTPDEATAVLNAVPKLVARCIKEGGALHEDVYNEPTYIPQSNEEKEAGEARDGALHLHRAEVFTAAASKRQRAEEARQLALAEEKRLANKKKEAIAAHRTKMLKTAWSLLQQDPVTGAPATTKNPSQTLQGQCDASCLFCMTSWGAWQEDRLQTQLRGTSRN